MPNCLYALKTHHVCFERQVRSVPHYLDALENTCEVTAVQKVEAIDVDVGTVLVFAVTQALVLSFYDGGRLFQLHRAVFTSIAFLTLALS